MEISEVQGSSIRSITRPKEVATKTISCQKGRLERKLRQFAEKRLDWMKKEHFNSKNKSEFNGLHRQCPFCRSNTKQQRQSGRPLHNKVANQTRPPTQRENLAQKADNLLVLQNILLWKILSKGIVNRARPLKDILPVQEQALDFRRRPIRMPHFLYASNHNAAFFKNESFWLVAPSRVWSLVQEVLKPKS